MKIKRFCMVGLSLILVAALSISFAFADVYDVDQETVMEDPIVLYTEGYTPGMYSGLDDNQSLYAITDYGSWSMNDITPFFIYRSSTSTTNNSFAMSPESATVSIEPFTGTDYYMLQAQIYRFPSNANVLTGMVSLGSSPYVDVSMSNFAYTQTESGADTLVFNGRMRFRPFFEFQVTSDSGTSKYWANLMPVAFQIIVDGKPVGQVFDIDTNYGNVTSDWVTSSSGRCPYQEFTFSNYKVYDVSKPELIGIRIFYEFSGSGTTIDMNPDNDLVTAINFYQQTIFSNYPTIQFVKDSPESDYSGDFSSLLSAIQSGLFNSNNVPFLDVVGSLLADTVDGIGSLNTMLSDKLDSLFFASSGNYLDSYGDKNNLSGVGGYPITTIVRVGLLGLRELSLDTQGLITDFNTTVSNSFKSYFSNASGNILGTDGTSSAVSSDTTVTDFVQDGFLGLGTLMRTDWGEYVTTGGNKKEIADNGHGGWYSLTDITRIGFLGMRERILDVEGAVETLDAAFDTFSAYVRTSSFSWLPFDLSTGTLSSSSATATGQNAFMQNAFQSVEDKLGRLTYVFANDEEIDLVGKAEPGLDAFKDSFGGGAKAGDIVEVADTFNQFEGMLDTGFSLNDLFDLLNGESWWSWFTTENAMALDSTVTPLAIGDEDPFNMQTYYDHIHAVEEIRSREEAE